MDAEPPSLAELARRVSRPSRREARREESPIRFEGGGYRAAPQVVPLVVTDAPGLPAPPPAPELPSARRVWWTRAAGALVFQLILWSGLVAWPAAAALTFLVALALGTFVGDLWLRRRSPRTAPSA